MSQAQEYHYRKPARLIGADVTWNDVVSILGQVNMTGATGITFREMVYYIALEAAKADKDVTWLDVVNTVANMSIPPEDGGEPWPDSLPPWPLMADYGESLSGGPQSVTPDNKAIIIRDSSSARINRMTLAFNMTPEQVNVFENFFQFTLAGGTKPIRINHPRSLYAITASFDPTASQAYAITNQESMSYFKVAFTVIVWR